VVPANPTPWKLVSPQLLQRQQPLEKQEQKNLDDRQSMHILAWIVCIYILNMIHTIS
jgi:hypothetical protein